MDLCICHCFVTKLVFFIKWQRYCIIITNHILQSMEDEEQQLQSEVSEVSDKGRQLSHSIDLSDHDKAIRIYRQVEDLKVCYFLLIF